MYVAEVTAGTRWHEVGDILGVNHPETDLALDITKGHRMVVDMEGVGTQRRAAVPASLREREGVADGPWPMEDSKPLSGGEARPPHTKAPVK